MVTCRLSEILYQKRMTQRQLCAETGFTKEYVNQMYHSKVKSISLDKLETLCKVLNVKPNDLFEID